MNQEDFVFNQIYKGALNKGASDYQAKKHATAGLDDYRKNKIMKRASHLTEDRVKSAIKDSKK